jgi:hypothetical protein
MPTTGASSGQVRRRRGSERATVRAMKEPVDQPPDEPSGNADLLTIGLVVFFLALILIVGALLLAPALF